MKKRTPKRAKAVNYLKVDLQSAPGAGWIVNLTGVVYLTWYAAQQTVAIVCKDKPSIVCMNKWTKISKPLPTPAKKARKR